MGLDTHTEMWSRLPYLPRDLEGRLSSVIVKDFMYIVVVDERHSTIWRMNLSKLDEWIELRQTHSLRTGCAVIADDDYIYVSGGNYQYSILTKSQNSLNNLARFDPGENEWTNLQNAQRERNYHASACVGDKIYMFGGQGSDNSELFISHVEVYDILKQTWSDAPKFPRDLFRRISTVVVESRWIVVVGTELDEKSSCVIFDTRTQTWIESVALILGFSCAQISLLDTKQIVFTGQNNYSFFTIQSIEFKYLHPWFSVGHLIMLRRLVDSKRATSKIKEDNKADCIIQRLVSNTDDDVFRKILSFLLYRPLYAI